MARSKYPGIQILYEVGTRQELAQSYGVSERTMYRWLNKAKAQTHERQEYPGAGPIARFKGTRKELAEKYNISERTAYRWLKKARESGADIPSRQAKSRYPGSNIWYEQGTNKSIGDRYGVSEATVRRWKNRARNELEQIDPMALIRSEEELQNVLEDSVPEMTTEQIEEFDKAVLGDDLEDLLGEEPEEYKDYDTFTNVGDLVDDVINMGVLSEKSEFLNLDPTVQREYMYAYIKYQSQHNKDLYYWVEKVGMSDIPSEDIASLNIWGDSFETFVQEQIALDEYSERWAK